MSIAQLNAANGIIAPTVSYGISNAYNGSPIAADIPSGMTTGEIAELLAVTERTVERQWAFAKAWLLREIRKAAGA